MKMCNVLVKSTLILCLIVAMTSSCNKKMEIPDPQPYEVPRADTFAAELKDYISKVHKLDTGMRVYNNPLGVVGKIDSTNLATFMENGLDIIGYFVYITKEQRAAYFEAGKRFYTTLNLVEYLKKNYYISIGDIMYEYPMRRAVYITKQLECDYMNYNWRDLQFRYGVVVDSIRFVEWQNRPSTERRH